MWGRPGARSTQLSTHLVDLGSVARQPLAELEIELAAVEAVKAAETESRRVLGKKRQEK